MRDLSSNSVIREMNQRNGHSLMEIDNPRQEEDDQFLALIDYARSVLWPEKEGAGFDPDEDGSESRGPGWSWIASRILKTCIAYSSGVTVAILLSELFQACNEQRRAGAPKKRPDIIKQLKKKHRRTKLLNTVTIDSIYEKDYLSLNSVLEAVIVDVFVLPGTNIYMLTLGDFWSSNTIDLYLHRRYYDLANPLNGILKKGREIFLTGCYLRTSREGCGSPRLLPTEYLLILLDEDRDDDAILLGAQFCSDSFSSISLDAANNGVSYSLYARIESIGIVETLGGFGSLQRKQITLVDTDGARLNFLLWGEQVLLANLFSVGSMLALDRPYIASTEESALEISEKFYLEYGSATLLYFMPFIQQEEQVCVALTQNRYHGSKLLSAVDPSQSPVVSQVTLPCDSQGAVNYNNYPFHLFISDLRDKMTGVSLYVVIRDILRERNAAQVVYCLEIEDTTGAVCAKLHFAESWSLGRLGVGHVVYISGLMCSRVKQNCLGLLWSEKDAGASIVNISCLPALLSSSCLHKTSCLLDLSSSRSYMHVCRVWLDQLDQYHVNTRFSHSVCGHFVEEGPKGVFRCRFCQCDSKTEIIRTFHLKITLADESSKVFVWCTGQTATELLQISPDEFYEMPEEEQVMYPSSLDNEKFMVALVNCKRQENEFNDGLTQENDGISWEITRALKCD